MRVWNKRSFGEQLPWELDTKQCPIHLSGYPPNFVRSGGKGKKGEKKGKKIKENFKQKSTNHHAEQKPFQPRTLDSASEPVPRQIIEKI